MPIQYMTQPQLDAVLTANGNLDPSVRQAVLDQLNADGVYDYPAVPGLAAIVQTGANAPLDPTAQVLDIDSPATTTVTTDDGLDVIVHDVPGTSSLTVFGSSSVFIAAGHGNNSIVLSDTGDDTCSPAPATTRSGGRGRGCPHRRRRQG